MLIQLKKFGTTLISRSLGQEAFSAFKPSLKNLADDEKLYIDFDGVNTFSPPWGDDFLTPIIENYNWEIYIKKTVNPSVVETLSLLEEIHKYKFVFIE